MGADRCCWKDCLNKPYWAPIIQIWAGLQRDHAPAELKLKLGVCNYHKMLLTPTDFLAPEGKRQIEEWFDSQQKARPEWTSAALKWQPWPPTFLTQPPKP